MTMIDPIHSLAFSIQANRGVYAVLVGSGVSRAAKIPTGWEITLDLIRKLAKLHGETSDPNPEHWYRKKFEKEASYSDLLYALAKTESERQQLLRAYFEPNDQVREEGEKEPTAAHRAIAALAAQGFIKVIITTNFDRLVETALREEGIEPTVLSSPDQVQGTLPLIHTQCCVFKVHGDYLDTRIKNTPDELDQYKLEVDQFLDRIFDEFGLIVCGWSAEWDGALRSALFRAKSHRFTTYWAVRGEPSDKAQQLISHRRAQVIPIEDAEVFFQTVQRQVESIEEFSRPHPLSTEAAVASLKRYIPDPQHRIRLSDLIDNTVTQVVEATSGKTFSVEGAPKPTTESVTERVRRYEAACSTLLAMATVGGRWVKEEEEHYRLWQQALEHLGSTTSSGGLDFWLNLKRYPAMLLLYALGLGATEANRLRFLGRMLGTIIHREHREDVPAVEILPPFCFLSTEGRMMRLLEGMDRRKVPLNDWIHETLQPYAERIIRDNNRYTLVFDKLEILMALSYARYKDKWSEWYWAPPGAFIHRDENRVRILREIKESLSTERDESRFVTCGIFGDTAEDCEQGLEALERFIPKLGGMW